MPLTISEQENCPNCDTPFQGPYCYQCGEKKLDTNQMTLRFFFAKVWSALTFADVKFLRSIKLLLFAPGRLTVEFFHGRHKSFAKPVALFFFINLVYFLYNPVDTLNSTFASQTRGQYYSDWASQKVDAHLLERTQTRKEFAQEYNAKSNQISKLFLFFLVLIFAVGVWLVNINEGQFFYVHLISATHFVSFSILGLLILVPFVLHMTLLVYLMIVGNTSIDFNPNATYVMAPIFLTLITYASIMQRKIYQRSWVTSSLKGMLLILMYSAAILVYRFFLFLATMALV